MEIAKSNAEQSTARDGKKRDTLSLFQNNIAVPSLPNTKL